MEYSWTGLNVKLLAGCILLFWIGVILVPCKESWCRFCTLHTVPAVRQVVFADVQITIPQRVAVLPVLGYGSELCSYWLTQNRRCLWLVAYKRLAGSTVTKIIGLHELSASFSIYRKEDVLFQPKIRGASEKFKNQLRPLLRPRSVNFRQHFRNLSRKTVPLSKLRTN